MRNRGFIVFSFLLVVGFLFQFACRQASSDRTSPEEAYTYYQELLSKGDYEGIYWLLPKEVRDQIDKSHANTREAVRLVEKEYPLVLKAEALSQIGPEDQRNAETPARFFSALIGDAGIKRTRLSATSRLALNVRKVQKTPMGTYEVQTVGGQRVEFTRGADGVFYLVPDKNDMAVIMAQLRKSIEVLEKTKENVRSFGTHKF
jgi:hypothetical protein